MNKVVPRIKISSWTLCQIYRFLFKKRQTTLLITFKQKKEKKYVLYAEAYVFYQYFFIRGGGCAVGWFPLLFPKVVRPWAWLNPAKITKRNGIDTAKYVAFMITLNNTPKCTELSAFWKYLGFRKLGAFCTQLEPPLWLAQTLTNLLSQPRVYYTANNWKLWYATISGGTLKY